MNNVESAVFTVTTFGYLNYDDCFMFPEGIDQCRKVSDSYGVLERMNTRNRYFSISSDRKVLKVNGIRR